MSFPDQSHIDRVRNALWRDTGGGASVMIGAGFSRCARKARPGASDPPTWVEMTKRISDKLYPREGDEDLSPNARKAPSTRDFLSLAQEYEAAFGRPELHGFIRQLIRDEDHEPDEMHRRLLRLPWRDVFTTNWDTLLEKTCPSIAERKYTIVRTKDEFPLGNPPRVVKLHGSLPSHFPLIFTEEDYRTYPRKFAPFVNMAQQAMMETVFCLIGFSGDDPNFLHWSGWVRDNMGESAPKIYLAGWLDLSDHRRRMLAEVRGVVPIDLARHPNADQWPEHLRHRYATDWILYTLEYGRPYDVTEWPAPLSGQSADSSIPDYLQPVTPVDSPKPKEEPKFLPRPLPDDWVKQTETVLEVWSHNRKIYPDWLSAPSSVFHSFNLYTDEWEPVILRALPELAPVDRLYAIRELVWRREISLVPVSSVLESAANDALQRIDCQGRIIDGASNTTVRWEDVREAWRHVALALVTAARHRFDKTSFDRRLEALSPFLDDDPDVAHRICHERCLRAIYSMDFQALEGLLTEWETANTDPIWMLRKAAILVETNRVDEAINLFEDAFSHIRRVPDDDRSVAGSSREGWALFWAAAHELGSFRKGKTDSPDPSRFHRRWRELASRKCDAREDKWSLSNVLSRQGEKSEPPLFDLNVRRGQGFYFSDEQRRRWVAARRAVRLSEVAGLPPSAFRLSMASDILTLAADELADTEPEMAVRLILRTVKYDQDKTLQRVLSRTRVATMPQDLSNNLVALCNEVIQYALPRLGSPEVRDGTMSWVERVRVALEVTSRLVLRLEPKSAEDVFDTALGHYVDDRFHHHLLILPLRRLLERSWETLPDQQARRIPDLLDAPIVGLDGFKEPFGSYDSDPGSLVKDDLPAPCRTADTEDQWKKIVNLLVRGLRAGGETRKRAAFRISYVALQDRLTESESVEVARALWDSRYIGDGPLPGETALTDVVFLALPEPEPGLAEQCFRKKWLDVDDPPQGDEENLAAILEQVGNAISWLKHRKRSLHLTKEEKSHLAEIAGRWAELPVPIRRIPFFEDQRQDLTRRSIIGLRAILSEILLPVSVAKKLYEKIPDLNESEAPGFTLIAGVVKAWPDRFDEIVQSMQVGLVSDNPTLAEDAAWGLFYWMQTSNASEATSPEPPIDLVHEIGVIVASRKSVSLDAALQIAKWIFDEGNEEQRDSIHELTLQGLGYLFEELRYDRRHERDEDSIPSLRRHCVELAVSMANQGLDDAPAVSRWLKDAESDPMPEVRYAKVRHAAVFKGDRNGEAPGNGEGAGIGTPGGDLRG